MDRTSDDAITDTVSHQQYVIEGLWPSNEVHLIGGASGGGKTTYLVELIQDWDSGRAVYGHDSHPSKFLYVACDRSLDEMKRTLDRLDVMYGQTEWAYIKLFNGMATSRIENTNIRNIIDIVKLAQTLETPVVFIDGLGHWFQVGKRMITVWCRSFCLT